MAKEKEVSTLIGIIIIVAAAVVAFGGVFGYQYLIQPNNQSQNQNQQPVTSNQPVDNAQPVDQTAEWKTYTNNEHGFEIKYPMNLTLEESIADSLRSDIQLTLTLESQNDTPIYFRIEVQINPTYLTANEYASMVGTGAASPMKNIFTSDIAISGVVGKKVIKDNPPSDANPQNPNYVEENTLNDSTIFLVKGDKLYLFEIYNKNGAVNYNSDLCDQIISTFKFTK